MAARYVYSGAGGAGTGADWANAHLTLSAAITASSAGDTFYVAHDHSHNYGGTTTLTFKGSETNPDTVLCVNRAGSVPPVAADLTVGAVEGTNASGANLTLNGNFYCYGVIFAPGSGQTNNCDLRFASTAYNQVLENCRFRLLATGSGSAIELGAASVARVRAVNCRVKFASTAQRMETTGDVTICGDASADFLESGSSVPTTLFSGSVGTRVAVRGLDLGSISGTIIGGFPSSGAVSYQFASCKLHASATLGSSPGYDSYQIGFVGCHSAGNVARDARYHYRGVLTTETTVKRTGGASDGTTSYSWKLVTSAAARQQYPFETFEGVLWNDATGSAKTLTIHTVTDNLTLTDAEIWLEVEYLGSSAAPISTLITDANATVLTAPANQASSSETWTTTGLTTPVKQKLEVTFTPQMAGPIRWRVCLAKASSTVYVCPKPELS